MVEIADYLLFLVAIASGPLAIFLGLAAKNRIKKSPDEFKGMAFAKLGVAGGIFALIYFCSLLLLGFLLAGFTR